MNSSLKLKLIVPVAISLNVLTTVSACNWNSKPASALKSESDVTSFPLQTHSPQLADEILELEHAKAVHFRSVSDRIQLDLFISPSKDLLTGGQGALYRTEFRDGKPGCTTRTDAGLASDFKDIVVSSINKLVKPAESCGLDYKDCDETGCQGTSTFFPYEQLSATSLRMGNTVFDLQERAFPTFVFEDAASSLAVHAYGKDLRQGNAFSLAIDSCAGNSFEPKSDDLPHVYLGINNVQISNDCTLGLPLFTKEYTFVADFSEDSSSLTIKRTTGQAIAFEKASFDKLVLKRQMAWFPSLLTTEPQKPVNPAIKDCLDFAAKNALTVDQKTTLCPVANDSLLSCLDSMASTRVETVEHYSQCQNMDPNKLDCFQLTAFYASQAQHPVASGAVLSFCHGVSDSKLQCIYDIFDRGTSTQVFDQDLLVACKDPATALR